MKIFYTGLQYDHYNKERGLSFEYNNFYLSLLAYPDADIVYFPFEHILAVGKERFNEELLDEVTRQRPDLLFVFMYSDEFDKATLEELKKYTTTVAWFADDSWRFYNYSKFWAKHFTWAITTYSWMPSLYKKVGQPNVIRSQWAASPAVAVRQSLPATSGVTDPDVSFVGGWTSARGAIVLRLRELGIPLRAFGAGWGEGRISEKAMLDIFSSSKINLGLNPPPGFLNKNSLGRLFLSTSINKIVPDFHIGANISTLLHRGVPQVKARHFEIPACGGFLMTSKADDLENYYEPGKEIVFYDGAEDLAEKAKYYLAHDVERKEIASAGHARTINEHTYEHRFREIFKTIFH